MTWTFDDGGRKAAGFRGDAGDCVARALAIAAEMDYRTAYNLINAYAKDERYRRGRLGVMAATRRGSSARTGVHKPTFKQILADLGWEWTPTMQVGGGCRVHLKADELPAGRLIVSVSKHLVAVIDGVIHDTHDPSRNGTRCVYGYWRKR